MNACGAGNGNEQRAGRRECAEISRHHRNLPLFITPSPYDVRRAHRTHLLGSGSAEDGPQAITYRIISAGRVRMRRGGPAIGRKAWAISEFLSPRARVGE